MHVVRLASLLSLGVLLTGPALGATVASVFGGRVPCGERDGVQFCEGGPTRRVESWDGVPLDVAITLPPAGQTGPFPLIVDLHGWGGSKNASPQTARAQAGSVVLSYTARGFGQSCGVPASRAPDPTLGDPDACAKRGWIRLADARYEARDTQHLAGLLADEGLVLPDRVGVTGVSYGGGQSMILAALRSRVMLPDGTLVPWVSPGGRAMTIAAAAPLIPWVDLAQVLTPNGRALDYAADGSYGTRAGVTKESWVNVLYGAGLANYYAPPGADPAADLPAWTARIAQGEPYDGDPLLEYALDQLTRFHSAYYVDDTTPPAPLFIYNAWTDDLFPGDEGIRFFRKTAARHPTAEIALHLADGFGHPRASLGTSGAAARVVQRADAFLARHLLGTGDRLPAVETYTQACGGAVERGPFAGASWDAVHPGEVRLTGDGWRAVTSEGGDPDTANALDPLAGGPCRTRPAADDPGAATYRFSAATGAGYTLLGAPTVIATGMVPRGSFAQVVGRLWDVAPDGTQTLVTHGIFRPLAAAVDRQVFQLHPNGWHFAAGHEPKLELLGQSPPYGREAGGRFWLPIEALELRLPVAEPPDGATITAPAAPVLPADTAEWPDVGVPACGTAPATDCAVSRKAKLTWRKKRIAWRWAGRPAPDLTGAPDIATGYRLCVWDPASRLVASAAVEPGSCRAKTRGGACWTGRRGRLSYRDAGPGPDAAQSASVAGAGASGRRRLAVRARPGVGPVRGARAQLLIGGLGCVERR